MVEGRERAGGVILAISSPLFPIFLPTEPPLPQYRKTPVHAGEQALGPPDRGRDPQGLLNVRVDALCKCADCGVHVLHANTQILLGKGRRRRRNRQAGRRREREGGRK